ncbi:DUF2141 domain-containing protein [Fulvivirga sp. M361]|uniref:DUF2141 domain-containing protein n=1 Tax=Fulvivirga sp. M361 TaxID=2594266 RepID=UPI001624B083|nr:DUF2141 domain-containing protein [Fulvivirga sp. M361]
MKKIIFLSVIMLTIVTFNTRAQGTIEVTVNDIGSSKGNIILMLFNDQEGFPSQEDKVYQLGKVKATKGTIVYRFMDLPYGIYAVSIYHDENDNGEMDKNFMGFPRERIGASKHSRLGKPSFDKASFHLTAHEKKVVLIMNFLN